MSTAAANDGYAAGRRQPDPPCLHVVLCISSPLVRVGVRHLLADRGRVEILAEHRTLSAVPVRGRDGSTPVLVTDSAQGEGPIREFVRDGDLPVVVIAQDAERQEALDLAAAGVKGIVVETATDTFLLRAVDAAALGAGFLSPEVSEWLASDTPPDGAAAEVPAQLLALSPRELEVYEYLAVGASNDEIGRALFISNRTVKFHVSNVLTKLDLRRRADAITFAHRQDRSRGTA